MSAYSWGIEIARIFCIAWGIPRFMYRFGHHNFSNNTDYQLFKSIPKELYITSLLGRNISSLKWVCICYKNHHDTNTLWCE